MQNVINYIEALNVAIDSRAAYERSKNESNDSIQTTLNAIRKSVTHATIAEKLLNSSVNAEFINRQERSNNRYNVYAAEKVDNAARASAYVAELNHYSLAILKVALAFEKNESKLSHADAVSACSASVKHKDAKREQVIKSLRYAKHVASNTATTQSSSSINALQTLNILCESRDAANVIVYSVNRENEIFKALAARYELAM